MRPPLGHVYEVYTYQRTELTDRRHLGRGNIWIYILAILFWKKYRSCICNVETVCAQIDQLKIKECKREMFVSGTFKYAVEIEQRRLSSNCSRTVDGYG